MGSAPDLGSRVRQDLAALACPMGGCGWRPGGSANLSDAQHFRRQHLLRVHGVQPAPPRVEKPDATVLAELAFYVD